MSAALAQAGADLRERLRSPASWVAVLVLLGASYLWIPAPGQGVTSLSWQRADGTLCVPEFSAGYVGTAAAILNGIFALLASFYMVARSLERDRRLGLGPLLASSPAPSAAYLGGKALAHAAYLGALSILILLAALARFAWFGVGPGEAGPLLLPWLLLAPPSAFFVAAMAVLFDVTPGLRGRAGLVAWFFGSILLFAALPEALARDPATGARLARIPSFDPVGLVSLDMEVAASLADVKPSTVSTGLVFSNEPGLVVPFRGPSLGWSFTLRRAASLAASALPLALALLLFDRFDPARRRLGHRTKAALPSHQDGESAPSGESAQGGPGSPRDDLPALTEVAPHPRAWDAVLAEATVVWRAAPWLRWPLLAAALGAALPGEAGQAAAIAFLLVVGPVIAEAAAREALAGTGGLVFSQPAVPVSAVAWKAAALAVFLLTLGAPLVVRGLLESPARGFAAFSGLLFVAALAAATGLLTGNGTLFTGLYLMLWYGMANRAPALDYCGVFGGALDARTRAAYALTALALLTAAEARSRHRAR